MNVSRKDLREKTWDFFVNFKAQHLHNSLIELSTDFDLCSFILFFYSNLFIIEKNLSLLQFELFLSDSSR